MNPGSGLNAWAIPRMTLALLAAGIAVGCRPLGTSQVSGRVLLIQGRTQLIRPDGASASLRTSMPLRIGDVLKTGDGDAAALSLTPGIAARLSGQSELKVEDLRMGESGGGVEERFAQVRLEHGAAMFSVASPVDREADLRVMASSIETGAEPGSAFLLTAPGNGAGGRLLCASGAVYWRDAARGQSGWVLSGQFQDFGAGAPRGISGDGGAQVATLELLNAVRLLNQLQGRLPAGLIPRAVKAGYDKILLK